MSDIDRIRRPEERVVQVAVPPSAMTAEIQAFLALPAVAVLPFANMSGDPQQEYFADGLTEDILTALTAWRSFPVVGRNSSFVYKGRSVDLKQIGRELAARYLLEGSVRKGGDRVRITGQLIEAETGGHLWADKFDGALADVFDLQDQVTAAVVGAIEPSVRKAEIDRAQRKRPENLDAYDLYLRALSHAYAFSPEGRNAALVLLDRALALDAGYSEAHGLAAWCRQQCFMWGGRNAADRAAALHHAQIALSGRSEDDASTVAFAAFALSSLGGEHESALAAVERLIAQNASSVPAHIIASSINGRIARYDRALDHAERALRLSPFDPWRYAPAVVMAIVRLAREDAEGALAAVRSALEASQHFVPGHVLLAVCLMRLGREGEARAAVSRVLKLDPGTRLSTLREQMLSVGDAEAAGYLADLRAAGLPE